MRCISVSEHLFIIPEAQFLPSGKFQPVVVWSFRFFKWGHTLWLKYMQMESVFFMFSDEKKRRGGRGRKPGKIKEKKEKGKKEKEGMEDEE